MGPLAVIPEAPLEPVVPKTRPLAAVSKALLQVPFSSIPRFSYQTLGL